MLPTGHSVIPAESSSSSMQCIGGALEELLFTLPLLAICRHSVAFDDIGQQTPDVSIAVLR